MRLAEISIRRPVFTIVLSILITLSGAIALTRLGVREYPSVDPPTIAITTAYAGAAAEVVQAQITEPIEEALNTVAGIETLTSTSREGASQISAEFSLDTNLETAASDVRDQLARAVRFLPPDVNPPILNKADADSTPIFGLALSSGTRTQLELGAYANTLKERLQTVPGIASVEQPAEKRYAMRLWMDPEKLTAYNLSPLDVRAAMARENIELPSGRIEGEAIELPVKTLSRLNTPAEFNALIVKRTADSVVRFSDIGYVALGAVNERSALKMGDTPIAGLYFKQQPGANQIEIVDALRARLDQIRKEIPGDIEVDVAYDNTEYVRRSLLEVTETIFIAFALVVLVVFAFLREWRTTLIPVIAIPVSIIGTFAIIHAAGFSINTLTLLGIVLSIGLVVDDAIVVLENIYAKIEAGAAPLAASIARTKEIFLLVLSIGLVVDDAIVVLENIYAMIEAGAAPLAASIAGTKEIFFAVVSTTLTLAVVFLPLLFMGGLSGRLFREFGVTIAGAVLISALVALTLTPMLCSRLLRAGQGRGWLFLKTEPLFQALERAYARGLGKMLPGSRMPLALLAVAAMLVIGFFSLLPRELAPMEDRGRLWVRATGLEGVGYEFMQSQVDELARATADLVPEAHLLMTQVPGMGGGSGVQGPVNTGFVRVFLKDKSERSRSQMQIVEALRALQTRFNTVRVNITQEASVGERRANETGVRFVVQAVDMTVLAEALPGFLAAAREHEVFTFVDSDLKFGKPEVRVTLDREKAQAVGVSALDIAQTLQASLSGQRFGYFIHEGKQYDVIGQVTRDFRSRPADLGNIAARSVRGTEMVRLDNLVSFSESSSPPELYRYNRYSAATVSGTLAPGRTLADGIAAFREVAAATLDERFTTSLSGAARDFEESSSSLGWAFALALLLIYLVLAGQFESFLDPLVILLTVPLALAGALFALWYFDQTLNLFSQIGLIMLVGLVTKNGILI